MTSSSASLILLTASVAMFGFGCGKIPASSIPPSSTTPSISEARPYLPPEPTPENEPAQHLRELREAFAAFQNVRTFKTKLSITHKGDVTTGQIDVTKPDRFHGTLKTPKDQTANEIIGIGGTAYIRLPNVGWIEVKTPSISKALTDAFQLTISADRSAIGSEIPDGTPILKQRDDARDCDAYTADLMSSSNTPVHMTACVKQNLPVYVDFQTAQGRMTMEYFDYNRLFTIERPTVTKLPSKP